MKQEKIGCDKFDKENPELLRSCGDILFNNKIWLCAECSKKKYPKRLEKIIQKTTK